MCLLFTRTEYTLAELKQKPPPEGVDPSRLEAYLNADDFQVVKNEENRQVIRSFVHSFVRMFLHMFVRSFACLLVCSLFKKENLWLAGYIIF